MNDAYETTLFCSACRRHVSYRRINFARDQYPDWRLEVFCGCGDVRDPMLLGLVREIYGRRIGEEIKAMQEAALVAGVGVDVNEWLNRRVNRGGAP